MNGCINYNERLCNFNSLDMPDTNAFIVISKNYIVSHHFCIYDSSFFSLLCILVLILVAICTKHYVYVALSFLSTMSRTLSVISWFCFLAKKQSLTYFFSTTNHNFLWIHNNNANAFSLLRNTSCLFHCSRHFILFLHFFSLFTLCTSTAYFLTC